MSNYLTPKGDFVTVTKIVVKYKAIVHYVNIYTIDQLEIKLNDLGMLGYEVFDIKEIDEIDSERVFLYHLKKTEYV
ncbi:hypothetical protein Phi18:2_gp16 [Cellulophaga phage phi18:2]|uniref:Uncharacterized protein n=2 Tax=Cellulophaga phage phi18:1 TaxID=1327982 RepID=S0A0S8_9CAUD|nr:hypothetical protein Phi18:1_gp16 [Cellulophaga phage phi18:1]AGO48463.1 hypothetical protein Phi18:1_gp16 [Cellulophaga phage phi18:1]AGO49179.1 hypothetical protein Phi18:2_gp16 [Cellulophaga phage phi18:2]